MSFKSYIKNIIYKNGVIKARYNDGKKDLLSKISHATPISQSQKEEILEFWSTFINNENKRYFDVRWFDVYNSTNFENKPLKYYIPDSFYYCMIDAVLSDPISASYLDDKNMYDMYFPEIKQPKTIVHKNGSILMNENYGLISFDEAVDKCIANESVIIKPSRNAMAGHGIVYWKNGVDDISDLKEILLSEQSYVIQDVIKQHEILANFNNSCVNTLRLVTLLIHNDVKVVSSTAIIGGVDSKTNHLHQGGVVCGIHNNGRLKDVAFDGCLNRFTEHPNSKIKFSDIYIPNYTKCLDIVKSLSPRFSNVTKLISWDLTIDESGDPILIEANLTWGGLCQIANGPVFGEDTEMVLHEVFNKN